jgi:transposase-like protein
MVVKRFPETVVLKSAVQQILEAKYGRDLPSLFEDWYVRGGMSQAEIAERLELDASTVSRWMKQWGIPLRYGTARTRRGPHLIEGKPA